MEFEIVFYKDTKGKTPIEEFLLALEKSNRALLIKSRHGINKLRYRFYHEAPLSKYIEPGLWELRVKSGSDILRVIYTFKKGQIIILLHAFIKKQQKTPENELEIARNRLEEVGSDKDEKKKR